MSVLPGRLRRILGPVGFSCCVLAVVAVASSPARLAGQAAPNQVPGAEIAMVQNIGGTGATVVTHILGREA